MAIGTVSARPESRHRRPSVGEAVIGTGVGEAGDGASVSDGHTGAPTGILGGTPRIGIPRGPRTTTRVMTFGPTIPRPTIRIRGLTTIPPESNGRPAQARS